MFGSRLLRAAGARNSGRGAAKVGVRQLVRPTVHVGASNVWSWGSGSFGALGLGDFEDQDAPWLVEGPVGALRQPQVTHIDAGWKGALAVTVDGRVFQWGWDGSMRSLLFAQRTKRRFGWLFSLLQRFTVLGRMTFTNATTTPMPVDIFNGRPDLLAKSAAVGGEQYAIVTRAGQVLTWGRGFFGELGHGERYEETFRTSPYLVKALKNVRIAQVSCGFQHTLFLAESGEIYSCGKTEAGALGIKDLPIEITKKMRVFSPLSIRAYSGTKKPGDIGKVVKVAAGFKHSVALDEHGRVWVCGKNAHGQLGIANDFKDRDHFVRVALEGRRVIDIAAGQFHTLVLTDDNVLLSWGANRHGQCGRAKDKAVANPHAGRTNPELEAVVQSMMPGVVTGVPACRAPFSSVSAGFLESVAVTEDGQCVMFGSGNHPEGKNEPYLALQDLQTAAVAVGFNTMFALGWKSKPMYRL